MKVSRRMLLSVLIGCPLMMGAQTVRDVAPLKHWPAPLYWQPTVEERAQTAKTEISGNGTMIPLAETPANSFVFVGMTPCRLVDTRNGSGFTGAFGPPSLVANGTRSFPLQASTTCSIPSIAQAYSLNITVVPPGFLGYLTIWAFGSPQPLASTLNDSLGTVVANATIAAAGNDVSGSVDVFVNGVTDLIIDINGYYAAQSGITLTQGSAGAPSVSFAGDSGTGIYSSGAGAVNVSAAKLEVSGNTQVDGGSILTSGGVPALQFSNNGSNNFSAGLAALPSNTTGISDTAVGNLALGNNTTGSGNTGSGWSALGSNRSGSDNTATGFTALLNNSSGVGNTGTGASALGNNTTGSSNTASGYFSLASLKVGDNNTATGFQALDQTTGSNNIAMGYQAGYNVTTASNNIHIGSLGTTIDSGAIRIGTTGTHTSAYIAGIRSTTTGSNDAVPVLIDSNGQLGTISSARRYKEDIQDMGNASSGLMRLRPVIFRYKKPFDDGSKPIQYGLIADEVAEVYPDLVARSADGQVETVKYQVLDSMLLNELQKQKTTIAAQKEQIWSLEERLARIEAALEQTSLAAASR